MSNFQGSCTVAPYSKTQLCNSNDKYATDCATSNATNDLITLSMRVLEKSNATKNATIGATNKLHELHSDATTKTHVVDAFSKESCTVALPKGGNYATHNNNIIRDLIEKVSQNYGGDDPTFLNDYIDDVLRDWSHDLGSVMRCFEELLSQTK